MKKYKKILLVAAASLSFATGRFGVGELKIGSEIRFADAAGYTMVKKNWFNGLQMPTNAVRRLDDTVEIIREFGYTDFLHSLS